MRTMTEFQGGGGRFRYQACLLNIALAEWRVGNNMQLGASRLGKVPKASPQEFQGRVPRVQCDLLAFQSMHSSMASEKSRVSGCTLMSSYMTLPGNEAAWLFPVVRHPNFGGVLATDGVGRCSVGRRESLPRPG